MTALGSNSRLSKRIGKAIFPHCRCFATETREKNARRIDIRDENNHREIIVKYLDGKDNGIVVLSLNRAGAKNALSQSLVMKIHEAVISVKRTTGIRALLLRSQVPGIFCAGADLRERRTMSREQVVDFVDKLRNLTREFETIEQPTIAAIDGPAIGGGLEIALAADVRTCTYETRMGLVETKLAIIPGAGGTQRLPRIIGVARAKELIFTGRMIDGREAREIGLVNRGVEQNKRGDAAYEVALDIARQILPNGPVGVRMAKVAISKGIELPIEAGLEIEKQCYGELLNTEDRLEGLAAFAMKRAPVYRGE